MSNISYPHLVLIPKVQMPKYLHQFRPIGLCNLIFKVMIVIVGRLKLIMPKLISKVESSFVLRHVTDNIFGTQEMIHSMRSIKRMKGKKGVMVIKAGLEKAYDRLSWSFIRDID